MTGMQHKTAATQEPVVLIGITLVQDDAHVLIMVRSPIQMDSSGQFEIIEVRELSSRGDADNLFTVTCTIDRIRALVALLCCGNADQLCASGCPDTMCLTDGMDDQVCIRPTKYIAANLATSLPPCPSKTPNRLASLSKSRSAKCASSYSTGR